MLDAVPKVLLDALDKKTKDLLDLKPKITELNEKMFADCIDYLFTTENPFDATIIINHINPSIMLNSSRQNKSGVLIRKHSFHSLVTVSSYNQIIQKEGYCDDVYQQFRKYFPKNILDEIKQLKSLVSEYKAKDKSVMAFCRSMNKQFNVDIKGYYDIFKVKYA